jgi:hypothetical protein
MKKRGIDLSSLVLSQWDCMPDMVSTTPILSVLTTLLLVTTEFLLKLHELCIASSGEGGTYFPPFEILYPEQ